MGFTGLSWPHPEIGIPGAYDLRALHMNLLLQGNRATRIYPTVR